MILNKLEDLKLIIKKQKKPCVAVAVSNDYHVLESIKEAVNKKIISSILIGNAVLTREICNEIEFDIENTEIIDEIDEVKACKIAVDCVRNNNADILMKGLVSTSILLKEVLDKDTGLRSGGTLSHFTIVESPYYHKLFGITDAAMNIAPQLSEKVSIINNAVEAMRRIGIKKPKVAVLGPVEVVNPKIESTIHAQKIVNMNKNGEIKNCIIDGPFALDNAISKKACQIKRINSEVGGDADILLAPEINAANILYKSLSFLGGAKTAAVIVGAKCPIVLTSRADSEFSKLYSIILSAAMLNNF